MNYFPPWCTLIGMKRIGLLLALVCVWGNAALPAFAQESGDRFLFQSAEQRFRSADYSAALERYDQFLREHPSSELLPDVQFRRAVCLYQLSRYEDAHDLFIRIQNRFRSSRYLPYVPYYLGMTQFQLGYFERSIASLQQVKAVEPAVWLEAQLYQARSSIALGLYDDVYAILEPLLESTVPAEIRGFAAALYVSTRYEQGQYSLASGLLDWFSLEDVPSQWAVQIRLFVAESWFAQNDFDRAREMYQLLSDERLEISAIAFERLYQIADATGTIDDVENAIQTAEQALAGKSAALKRLWLRVGLNSFENQDFPRAELYLRRVWDLRGIHPVRDIVPLYLAEIAGKRAEYDRAILVLEQYREKSTSDTVLFRLASLYAIVADWQQTIRVLEEFQRDWQDSGLFPQASYLYAYALSQVQEFESAMTVLASLRESGMTSNILGDVLRLESRVLRHLGNTEDAVDALRDYCAMRPDDVPARTELVVMLFELERYDTVRQEFSMIRDAFPRLSRDFPNEFARLVYVRGLTALVFSEYVAASEFFDSFSSVGGERLGEDIKLILPYNLFYHGWAEYQQGLYTSSFSLFQQVMQEYPDSPLAPRAAYLAGWSAYADGRFAAAVEILPRVMEYQPDDELAADSWYLLAQAHMQMDDFSAAVSSYRTVFATYGESSRSLDARFGYAESLLELGRRAEAAEAFQDVFVEYPDSFLGSEALFRRAQVLLDSGDARKAQEDLFSYRRQYPQGERVDDALYIGGQIAKDHDEPSGAILLWNRLIDQYPESPFRFDAMYYSAQLYRERGEYREALNRISEANARYPEQAQAVGGFQLAEELVLMTNGISGREAELRVALDANGGIQTAAGRAAALELGHLLISDSMQFDADSVVRVLPLLRDMAALRQMYPDAAAESFFLLGEYYMRLGELKQAAEQYVQSAAIPVQDREITARSLLLAVEAFWQAGESEAARQLAIRIEEAFPDSRWSRDAQRVVGGAQ